MPRAWTRSATRCGDLDSAGQLYLCSNRQTELDDSPWTEITLGIRKMALLTFSSGTCDGVPCSRMKEAERTSGKAEEKMMQVIMKEIKGSE